ncbi:trichohyalin-like [Poeciliopsis prolifica]|uniref:trichohyalin-like n=1 Tax=Poeciliopsis prolifica TaxID=188132 RepID=UPI0024141B9C|nr:trichohyalin-like [Poeciliopsis prolifica]XP_054879445.1 trichohyalin-like [Poeciliopsis prolifica]XP_054879446.1 trichohyalin-like [Poeciliopsis prolifica]XP_054879447.1 trichohyalin-like [Poeciliopsis prolifica]
MERKRNKMEEQTQLMSQVAEDVKDLRENMRREKGRIKYLKKKVRPNMQRVIFEPDEISEMLHMIREDTKLCKKHFFEEKTQIKWMSFQAEKRRKKLDQKLEKIIQEGDQLDILKKKMDQQRQETEKKWKEILTLLLISEKIKISLEKSTEEIRSTNQEMLKSQQNIRKSNEVKTYMDRLTCIKNQINKWKLTQPPFTFGLLKEKLECTHKEEILTDKAKKSAAEKNPLENITTSEGYVMAGKTEIHEKFFKHISQRKSFPQEIPALENQIYTLNEQEEVLVQIKTNTTKLQEKTQKMKSIVTELDEIQCQKEDAEVIIRKMGTVESTLLQEVQKRDFLMERTNAFREQIMQTDLEDQSKTTNVEQKPDKMEKWKEDPQALAKEIQVCSDGKYLRLRDLQSLWAEIYKTQQVIKCLKPEIECQDGTGNETKDLVDNDIKGLLQDLRQFQKLLETEMGQKKQNLNVDTCIQKSTMKKKRRELDHKMENILREKDELEILKTQIQRKSEGTQRQLEKILKCQNDIEKIAGKAKEKSKVIMCNMKKTDASVRMFEDLNKKIEASKQHWNKIYFSTSQHKALTEKLKTELGNENERESLFERENRKKYEKLVRDKSFTSKKAKQAEETFEEFLVLTPHQKRLIEEIKLVINQCNDRKCNREVQNLELSEKVVQEILRKVSEMLVQETEGQNGKLSQMKIEQNKKALLSETNKRQKQHMTEGQDSIKWTREIGELEVLNTELEIKRKGNKAILKQMVRERGKNERVMNKIKEAKILFKREEQRRRRELDQRLEKIRREKDELEMLKLKLRQPKVAMFRDNQNVQDQRTVVCVSSEYEQKDLEKNGCKITNTQYEMVPISPRLRSSIDNIQDLGVKIYGYLETGKSEICQFLKYQNIDLDKKRDELIAITAENNIVKENITRIKFLIRMVKITKQATGNEDETWKLRKDTHKKEFGIKSLTTKQKAQKRKALMTEMVTEETKHQKQKKRKHAKDPCGDMNKMKTTENLKKHVKAQMETFQVRMKQINLKNIKKGIELCKIQATHRFLSNMDMQLEENSVKMLNLIDIITNIKERIIRHENQLTAKMKDNMEITKTEINQKLEEANGSLAENYKEKIKLDIITQGKILQQEKQDTQEERQRLNITNAELNQKAEETSSCLIRNDIQTQSEILQQHKQDIQQHKQELESTMVELHKKTEETKNLFDGINKEKSKLKDVNLNLKTQDDKLKVLIDAISSKLQEPEGKGPEIHTKTPNLELCRKTLQMKKQELMVLMKNVNSLKESLKDSMSSVHKGIEQMISMKKNIGNDREKLSSEKNRLQRELSECKMRQDKLLDVMKSKANLRLTLQGVKDKVCDLTNIKMRRLHKCHKDAQLLCISMEKNVSTIGDQMKTLTPYKEVAEREKINLTSITISMRNERKLMGRQWKEMVDRDKKDLNKMTEELKRKTQNLVRVTDRVDKKEALEVMMTNIQKQRAVLQQEKQDIQEERENKHYKC